MEERKLYEDTVTILSKTMIKAGCVLCSSMTVITVIIYIGLKLSGREMPHENYFLYSIMTTVTITVFTLIVYLCDKYAKRESITTMAAIAL
jgi:hypothetical protein